MLVLKIKQLSKIKNSPLVKKLTTCHVDTGQVVSDVYIFQEIELAEKWKE
jgi:hypothetical protein